MITWWTDGLLRLLLRVRLTRHAFLTLLLLVLVAAAQFGFPTRRLFCLLLLHKGSSAPRPTRGELAVFGSHTGFFRLHRVLRTTTTRSAVRSFAHVGCRRSYR